MHRIRNVAFHFSQLTSQKPMIVCNDLIFCSKEERITQGEGGGRIANATHRGKNKWGLLCRPHLTFRSSAFQPQTDIKIPMHLLRHVPSTPPFSAQSCNYSYSSNSERESWWPTMEYNDCIDGNSM